jgi:acyl carrier protein
MDVLSSIVYPALDEAKRSVESARGIEAKGDSVLFGPGGLDSLGLVRFIVIVEERISDQTDRSLTLASDKAMSRKNSPFRTLATLADYITECLAEEGVDG